MAEGREQASAGARAHTLTRAAIVLYLAWQGIRARKLTTALMLSAMAAAIGFQIPNEANFRGYHRALVVDGTSAGFGAVRVRTRGGSNLDHVAVRVAAISKLPGVDAAMPILALPGAVRKNDAPDKGMIYGVDFGGTAHPYRLIEGTDLARGDDGGVLLGVSYAADLGASVGDEVTLHILVDIGPQALDEDRVVRKRMVVRGLVSGVLGAHLAAFVDRGFLLDAAGMTDEASMIAVFAGDPLTAGALAARVRPSFPEARVTTWREDSDFLRSALGSIEALSSVSVAMGVTAVAIPVFALLYIDLLRRRREIGLLAAVGFGQGEILLAFLTQALLTCLLAIVVGAAIGTVAIEYFDANPIFESESFVVRPLPGLHCYLRPALVVLATALASAAVPAWLAARTPPARILRSLE